MKLHSHHNQTTNVKAYLHLLCLVLDPCLENYLILRGQIVYRGNPWTLARNERATGLVSYIEKTDDYPHGCSIYVGTDMMIQLGIPCLNVNYKHVLEQSGYFWTYYQQQTVVDESIESSINIKCYVNVSKFYLTL